MRGEDMRKEVRKGDKRGITRQEESQEIREQTGTIKN